MNNNKNEIPKSESFLSRRIADFLYFFTKINCKFTAIIFSIRINNHKLVVIS